MPRRMPDCQPEPVRVDLKRAAILRPLIRSMIASDHRLLLAAHSQTPGFQTLPCLVAGPTIRPTPEVLPRLAMLFVDEPSGSPVVTSLVGVTPRASARMHGSPRHSFRVPGEPEPRFPQAEEASSRVSLTPKFFAVWHRLHWDLLASPCGPFVVELFIRRAFRLSAPRRAAAIPPGPPVTRSETPHASQVERTADANRIAARTPWTGLAGFLLRHPL